MKKPANVTLNVLGVREDEMWCAIALEMSLLGYGETFEDALEDLKETIIAQVTYAIDHHQSIDHIFIPAEPHYFELHARLKAEALKNRFLNRSQSQQTGYLVGSMRVPRIKASSRPEPQPVS